MKISLYGSVSLRKDYCAACDCEAFVFDGKLACCNRAIKSERVTRIKRESNQEQLRLDLKFKMRVLKLQESRCYFCGCHLDEPLWYRKKNKWRRLHIEFDHFIPRSFGANNHIENIYALCNLCNHHKSNKMFETRKEAVDFVMQRRKRDGTLDLYSDFERRAFETMPST